MALWLCAAVVLGLICGRLALSHYSKTAIELLIGVPVLVMVFPRPLLATTVVLGLLSTIFPYGVLPRVTLPGHPPVGLPDVLLFAAVGGTIWRRPWRTWPPPVRGFAVVLGALLVFAGLSAISLSIAGDYRNALLGFKTLLYFAFGLTIALELSDKLWKPLLNVAVAVAAVVALLSVAAAASSVVANHLTSIASAAITTATPGTGGSTGRIRLPGLLFVYAMSLPTLVLIMTVRDRWRPWRVIAFVLMIAAVALSLNRNMYVGAVIGLMVTAMVGGVRVRHRIALGTVIVAATLFLVVGSGVAPGVSNEITKRAGSTLSSQVLTSGSLQARAGEYAAAFKSIPRHPLLGVGWFQNYGAAQQFSSLGYYPYVENFYLHLATDDGIPALLAFLAIPGFLLWYGFNRARDAQNPSDRGLLAACMGAMVALLLSCLVGTYLQSPDSTATFGAACGLLLAAGLRAVPRPPDPLVVPATGA
jgi:O-Antigen ligase